jgi:hypothetical protein
MKKAGVGVRYEKRAKIKRPGVKAKSQSSRHKSSKNYIKPYNGQGR